ncbi:hypothetical protein [Halostreptopolyspora alba]|uniref:Uncharacterized protein n=1 Tax=Halostreptopolyspora alba TaxID=2487137 RepID=A0A3N0E6V2_9ACTN|nr:hypothetical protein EFW17_16000 [Nocardiopsaceae bacterium YIM 96095]
MSRFRIRPGSDTGASFVQYAGVLVVIGAICAAAFVSVADSTEIGDRVKGGVQEAFCNALSSIGLDVECDFGEGDAADEPNAPRCTLGQTERSESIHATAYYVSLGQSGGDNIRHQVDPQTGVNRSIYTTSGRTRLGGAFSNEQDLDDVHEQLDSKNKPEWEAFIRGGGGFDLNYYFEGENARDDAEQIREDRRGSWWQRWLAATGGASGAAIEGLAGEAAHQIERGWAWVTGGDTDAVDDKYEEQLPDSVSIDLSAEAAGSASYSPHLPGVLDGEIEGGLEGSGGTQLEIHDDFRRTHWTTFSVNGELKGEGGLDFSSVLPAEVKAYARAAGGVELVQRTRFDEDGNPQFVDFRTRITHELRGGARAGANLEEVLPKGTALESTELAQYWMNSSRGRLSHNFRLDLEDPNNRSAFEEVFNTDTGMLAIPRPEALANPQRSAELGQHLAENSIETFDVYSQDWSLGTDTSLERPGWGGGVESETVESTLESSEIRDNTVPNPEWRERDC